MLDELSNIETWGGLRNAITQGGGNGYQLLVVEQSRDMMVRDYDRETEQTVWNNCNRIMLGGVTDRDSSNGGACRSAGMRSPVSSPHGIRDRARSEGSRNAAARRRPYCVGAEPSAARMDGRPARTRAPALVHAPHFMERDGGMTRKETGDGRHP